MQLWRITAVRHATTAFSGEGARKNAARWHKLGTPMVYTSPSLALASVEFFVNLDLQVEQPELVAVPATLPDEFIQDRVQERDLPESWRDTPSPACLATGMLWFESKRSVALIVPSASVMHDFNVLLNPEHPDFKHLVIGEAQPFRFDRRMFRRA